MLSSASTVVTPRWFLMDVAMRFLHAFKGERRYLQKAPDGCQSLLLRVSVPMLGSYSSSVESAIKLSSVVAAEFARLLMEHGATSVGFINSDDYPERPQPILSQIWDPDVGIRFELSDPGPQVWCVVVIDPPEIPLVLRLPLSLTSTAEAIVPSHA